MGTRTLAVLITIAFSVIGVLGDYFLKLASAREQPLRAIKPSGTAANVKRRLFVGDEDDGQDVIRGARGVIRNLFRTRSGNSNCSGA